MIPHSRPTIGKEEAQAAARVIRSGLIAQGPLVQQFEQRLAQFVGVRYGVAVSSGWAALVLSLRALDIGPQDEVILPAYVCSALLQAVKITGAKAVFADIDKVTWNISAKSAARVMSRKTRAIIVPHSFGTPAPLKELQALGVPLIEDCAQSLGATVENRQVGSFGACSIVSFYATKMMTTGEGGIFLTNSKALAEKARVLREYDEQAGSLLRYNFKMTDLAAAIGLVQLRRLPSFIRTRRILADCYDAQLKNLPLSLPQSPFGRPVYHRYVVTSLLGADKVLRKLEKKNIKARRPIHHVLSPKGECPNADWAWEHAVSLPLYPTLSKKDIHYIIKAVKGVLT